jgi:outer membrane protein assembly factor BamB
MMRTKSTVIKAMGAMGAALTLAIASLHGASEDWPQWRGPHRTGILPTTAAPSAWPEQLKKSWSVAVGEGYSSPVGGGGRVYLHARLDPDEVVIALDAASGKQAWEQKYPAPMTKNPYAKGMLKGPYSTPLLADGRLYTLGTTAILSAWNASTGALLWRKDYSARIDTSKLFCGTAMSPIRTAEGIIVHIGDDRGGTITAFDRTTGKERWSQTIKGPGYASPIELQLGGARHIVTMTTRSVVGIAPENGVVLWEFPFDDEWNENIVTPIATPTGVIVSGVRQGTRALTLTKSGASWTATQAWHTPDVAMYMSSPVLIDGVLFGHSAKRKGQFVALSPASGKILWSTEGRAGTSASVIAAGTHLLFLTTDSELVVAQLDPSAYRELRRYSVASTPTYAHPMLADGAVIVRDANSLTRWSLN